MKKHTSHLTTPLFTKTLLSALIAVSASGAYAQDNNAGGAVEEVLVTGQFQRNLQNALDIKRNSTTIVDGISADDIGSLPALDMGEALQAVAGVQLNREGERRESSVNLRGLPAGFVLTTVNGQQMATPTRVNNLESSPFGAASPLGAFDPAVFSGIQVIKTTTANMIEGGISGTINQAVGGALKKRDGKYVVSIANRYEDLEESNDPEIVLSASKHLIADTLAATATFATSDQTFRRDTIKINQYNDLTTGNFRGANGETLAAWKSANGLNADDTVQIPGELRQGSEISEGTRTSFSGGLEWQTTDELKLGYNLMYTNRDMDQNTQQELDLRPRITGTKITPLSAPFATGKDATSGGKIYSVSDIAFTNVQYGATSRIYDLSEESAAHIFDAVWELDRWTLDAKATLSASESVQSEVFFSPTYRAAGGANGNNGISGTLVTGRGNIGNYDVSLTGAGQSAGDALSLDQAWVSTNALSTGADVASAAPNLIRTTLTGSYRKLELENNAAEANAKYMIEMGPLESIQFGGRYSTESQDFVNLRNSPAGINFSGIYNNSVKTNPHYYSNGASSFFGGEAPGFAGPDQGWFAIDVDKLLPQLTATIDVNNVAPLNGETAIIVPGTGLVQRAGQQTAFPAYQADIDTVALYAMSDFKFEMGNIPVALNVGARWLTSDVSSRGLLYKIGQPVDQSTEVENKDDYNFLLPSLNAGFDLTDDLKLRLAYNQTIVRPNIATVSPLTTVRELDGAAGSIDVRLSGAQLEPLQAESFDLSLEWYNREGSSISLALFRKDIDGYFTNVNFCNESILRKYGIDSNTVGTLSFSNGECTTPELTPGLPTTGQPKPVTINQLQNSNETSVLTGAELSIQQNLSFLPYPWDGLGGVINYSRINQDDDELTTNKIVGISEGTTNLIVYFEQGDAGVRLSYNYRTEYDLESTNAIAGVGTGFNGAGDKSVKAAGRLDLSAYYKITDDLTINFKAYNLTDTLYEEYQDTEYQPRATHYDGKTYVLQAKYQF